MVNCKKSIPKIPLSIMERVRERTPKLNQRSGLILAD